MRGGQSLWETESNLLSLRALMSPAQGLYSLFSLVRQVLMLPHFPETYRGSFIHSRVFMEHLLAPENCARAGILQ